MSLQRLTAALLIVEGLLIFVPLGVLGAAINWPASLGDPASRLLPALHANLAAVRLGYAVYLAYSLLFFPAGLLVARLIAGREALPPLLSLAVGLAALSTLARSLGILRWLSAMPALAALYVAPAASLEARAAVEVTYLTLNLYGGAVGEVLGVSLFAALWLLLVSLAILRQAAWPRWLGVLGCGAALLLALPVVEVFGLDLGPAVTVATTAVQLWFLAAGARLWGWRLAAA